MILIGNHPNHEEEQENGGGEELKNDMESNALNSNLTNQEATMVALDSESDSTWITNADCLDAAYLEVITSTVSLDYTEDNVRIYLAKFGVSPKILFGSITYLMHWTAKYKRDNEEIRDICLSVIGNLFGPYRMDLHEMDEWVELQRDVLTVHVDRSCWADFTMLDSLFDLYLMDIDYVTLILLEAIRTTAKVRLDAFEKIFELFAIFEITDHDTLISALVLFFIKCDAAAKLSTSFFQKYPCVFTQDLYYSYLTAVDHFYQEGLIEECMNVYELDGKVKRDKDLKKFINFMYNSPVWPIEPTVTPRHVENFNYSSLGYLCMNYKDFKMKNMRISNEAFLELSLLLIRDSPTLKNNLLGRYPLSRMTNLRQEWFKRYEAMNALGAGDPFANPAEKCYTWKTSRNALMQTYIPRCVYIGKRFDNFEIIFVDDDETFEAMVKEFKELKYKTIGVKTEWRQFFEYRHKLLATMQIACFQIGFHIHVYVVNLVDIEKRSDRYKQSWNWLVNEVLHTDVYTKLAYGFSPDLDMLRRTLGYKFHACGLLDLHDHLENVRTFFASQDVPPNVLESDDSILGVIQRARTAPQTGLGGLAQLLYILFGVFWDRAENLSDWNRRPLRCEQLLHASLGAYSLLHVYNCLHALTRGEMLSSRFGFKSVHELLNHANSKPSWMGVESPNERRP